MPFFQMQLPDPLELEGIAPIKFGTQYKDRCEDCGFWKEPINEMLIDRKFMKKWKIAVRITIFLCCAVFLLLGLTVLLKDRRVTFDYDTTRKVEGFYAEEENSLDFVFVGSSQMFTTVVPAVLWEEYGITSYDFGANEQPMYLSYYYIKEALNYQQPKAIVLEVSYCKGLDYTHEGVHHINLDDLKMGPVKLEAIFDIIPEEERWPYIFELAKYHDTWPDLNKDTFKYLVADKHNPYKGYTPSVEGFADGGVFNEEIGKITERAELPEFSVNYMEKIIALCEEKGVDLVFLKTPNDHIDNQPYYNAGIMLMDVKAWRERHLAERFLDELEHPHGPVVLGDQDVYPRAFPEEIALLHPKWNFISHFFLFSYEGVCRVVGGKGNVLFAKEACRFSLNFPPHADQHA